MARTYDVAVVGGGVIGLSCAFRLAKDGLRVVVLERHVCGGGASWAAAGIISLPDPQRRDPSAEFQRRSAQMFPDFCKELHELTGIDPEYDCCGSVEVFFSEQDYRTGRGKIHPKHAGPHFVPDPEWKLLSPQDLNTIYPGLASVGSGLQSVGLLGGVQSLKAAQVRPPRLLRALRRACELRGVDILEGTGVLELSRDPGPPKVPLRVTGVRTSSETYSARFTILAAGAWSSQIPYQAKPAVDVFPVRGQIVLLDAGDRCFRGIVEDKHCYLVPRRDGQVLVGATLEPEAGFVCRNTASGVNEMTQAALRLMPSLSDARFVAAWAGLRPATTTGHPIIGQAPDIEGLLLATGHYRNGIALAPITAERVSDLIQKL